MTIDHEPVPSGIDAETVLTAAFKLLGIYMLFSAVLQSSSVMSAAFEIAAVFANPSQVSMQRWGMLATSMVSVVMGVGVAVLLIRHGNRAAHWLSIRADLHVPAMTPSRAWYRGSLLFIGVWVLATKLVSVAVTIVWVVVSMLDETQDFAFPSPFAYAATSAFHVAALLAIGLLLIFGAARLGDWLHRISGAANAEATPSETV